MKNGHQTITVGEVKPSAQIGVLDVNGNTRLDRRSGHRAAHSMLTDLNGSRREQVQSKNGIGQEYRVSLAADDAARTRSQVKGNGGSMHLTKKHLPPAPAFRALGEYDNKELRAVKFRSDNEADRALVLIGKSTTLKRMPFLFADALTFIVPEEAINVLKTLRLRFKVSTVLDMDDLDPAERSQIRRFQSL